MRDEWEKPLPEQGCIRMVEGVLGIEIQTEIQDNTGGGNTREKAFFCTFYAGKRNTGGNTK